MKRVQVSIDLQTYDLRVTRSRVRVSRYLGSYTPRYRRDSADDEFKYGIQSVDRS